MLSRRALLALAALAAPSAAALTACQSSDATDAPRDQANAEAEPSTSSTFAFDTYCTFTVYGDATAPALLARECARYDELFDLYDPASDIARVNAASGAPLTVDPPTAEVVEQALAFCAEAGGLFDITIGAVSQLWDFAEGVRPSDAEIAAALAHVDWRGVAVDTSDPEAPTITLADAQAALDLGGIATGFIADRVVETLREKTKATAAVISLGGNIICYGDKPDGGSWDIGIRDPNDPGGSTVMGTAHVHATSTPDTSAGAISLVTSGLYERTFELDSVTYWHILDPQTGMPVETDVESVTVCCPSSTQADALSTALFVAGSERGITLVDSYENTAAYFILADGSTRESARWQELTD